MSEKLDRVLEELADAIDGKRHLPVLRPADAEAICGLFHDEVDRGTAARNRAVEAAGRKVACHDGCSQCCNNIPVVFAGEAITIARWLGRPENAAARDGFLARYPAWLERAGEYVERYEAAAAEGDVQGCGEASRDLWFRQVMCAFNHEGRCTIYPVRPNICRRAHALDTPENCIPAPMVAPEHWIFEPLEEYMTRVNPVVFAMHQVLRRDDRGARPVCVAVFDWLQPGRNDPCHCGSGKKFKHCHGRGSK